MSIKNAIVLLIISSLLCLAFFYIKDGIKQSTAQIRSFEITADSLVAEIDSLNHEIFHKQMTIGKYEMALELLKEQDPKAAEEFELILNTQTE